MSRQQRKLNLELDRAGLAIEDVFGSRKASPLLLCLTKALIIFMVCVGTVTGFCDAFSLNYNRFTIVVFTLVCSVLISLLYCKKKVFYIGYVIFLLIFTLELIRYYLYANSGFQAITNRIREVYADVFDMSVTRTAEEYFTNRQLTITITLLFIISFLVIMYNITVSRYMNFAETFGISFILLQIPLYVGYKPPIFSVILIMAGCICTGLLQKGAFNRVTVPGKNAPDYIRDKIFKKTYFTTRGNHGGVLLALGFSLAFSLIACMISLPVYNRDQGETTEGSAKSLLDDTVKILVQNGISGLFNRYDSLNGLNRGLLGGVSSVSPDFRTDLVVSFVPYGEDTVYLPGFKGVTYHGSYWDNKISTEEFSELGLDDTDYVDSAAIDKMDYNITEAVLKDEVTASAGMQISYIDRSFGMMVYPYITYPENIGFASKQLYQPKDPKKETVLDTKEVKYYPLEYAEYVTAKDFSSKDMILNEMHRSLIKSVDELDGMIGIKGRNLSNIRYTNLSYYDYVYDVCTFVPDSLMQYLKKFGREHGNYGMSGLNEYNRLVNELHEGRGKYFAENDTVQENFTAETEPDSDRIFQEAGKEGSQVQEEWEQLFEKKNSVNEFRISACEAIRDMFLSEYPYTLSPGKTPNREDFVQYFLESQKRGLCSHFASAGVMILRSLGIPARYVEGYCIPYSLVSESASKLDEDGAGWFSAENDFNPEKKMYSVPVSDYYAHAWIEVYLEGKGFVPFEVTPPSFEAAPVAQEMSGIGRFFSQILNVDLGLGNSESDGSIAIDAGDADVPVIALEEENKELSVLVKPLAYILGAVFIFWMIFILIRRAVFELRNLRYKKEGKFEKLIYIRYSELVKKLYRKKIIIMQNPLPMELCDLLCEYRVKVLLKCRPDTHDLGKQDMTPYEFESKLFDRERAEMKPVFEYIERVLYSDIKTDEKEYSSYYSVMKLLPGK